MLLDNKSNYKIKKSTMGPGKLDLYHHMNPAPSPILDISGTPGMVVVTENTMIPVQNPRSAVSWGICIELTWPFE